MNKIVLASSSPRRKELLEREGIDFIVDASSIDEQLDESLPIFQRLCHLAKDKAFPIHQKYKDDIVIGADTVIYFQNQIIGKPKNKEDAYQTLKALSNNTHSVLSAVAIYKGDRVVSFCEETKVKFKNITPMIEDYLMTDEWIDKAGSYAIQGLGSQFVDFIDGSIDTVIGLPVAKVVEYINTMK